MASFLQPAPPPKRGMPSHSSERSARRSWTRWPCKPMASRSPESALVARAWGPLLWAVLLLFLGTGIPWSKKSGAAVAPAGAALLAAEDGGAAAKRGILVRGRIEIPEVSGAAFLPGDRLLLVPDGGNGVAL